MAKKITIIRTGKPGRPRSRFTKAVLDSIMASAKKYGSVVKACNSQHKSYHGARAAAIALNHALSKMFKVYKPRVSKPVTA